MFDRRQVDLFNLDDALQRLVFGNVKQKVVSVGDVLELSIVGVEEHGSHLDADLFQDLGNSHPEILAGMVKKDEVSFPKDDAVLVLLGFNEVGIEDVGVLLPKLGFFFFGHGRKFLHGIGSVGHDDVLNVSPTVVAVVAAEVFWERHDLQKFS